MTTDDTAEYDRTPDDYEPREDERTDEEIDALAEQAARERTDGWQLTEA